MADMLKIETKIYHTFFINLDRVLEIEFVPMDTGGVKRMALVTYGDQQSQGRFYDEAAEELERQLDIVRWRNHG